MKKVFVIDNYDSFTYNLVHYIEELGCEVVVKRNDQFQLDELEDYGLILLSPGPGIPDEAGLLKTIIKTYASNKPILGVCLGQQAIAEVFGGTLLNLKNVYHGVATKINITVEDEYLFDGLDKTIEVGRYHSWVIKSDTLPKDFVITSEDADKEIMSLSHKTYNVKGLQFHPESILTEEGRRILFNFLKHSEVLKASHLTMH